MTKPAGAGLSSTAMARGLLAGFLAWLVPGGGHLFLGARLRGFVFLGLVTLTVSLGVAFDGNLSVVDARTPWLSKLQVAANIGMGPWEPLLRSSLYGKAVYVTEQVSNPQQLTPPLYSRFKREFRPWSAYGSIYLMAAGLMNILLILDAWDIAIRRKE